MAQTMHQMRHLWHTFINCSANDTNIKNQSLDSFLNYCLKMSEKPSDNEHNVNNEFTKNAFNNGIITEDMSRQLSLIVNVGNVLINQFVSDVQFVCASIAKTEDEQRVVMRYLFGDRGWKLLKVIRLLNVNALLYSVPLSNLLVHLLPLLIDFINTASIDGSEANEQLCIEYVAEEQQSDDRLKCFQLLHFIEFKMSDNEPLTPAKVKSWLKFHSKRRTNCVKTEDNVVDSVSDSDDTQHNKLYAVNTTNQCFLNKGINIDDFSTLLRIFISNDQELYLVSETTETMQSTLLKPIRTQVLSCIIDILTEFTLYEQLNFKYDYENSFVKSGALVSHCVIEKLNAKNYILDIYKLLYDKTNFRPIIQSLKNLLFISCCSLSTTASGVKMIENSRSVNNLISIIKYLISVRHSDANRESCDIFCGAIYLLTSVSQYLNVTKEYSIVLKLIRVLTHNIANNELFMSIVSSEPLSVDTKTIVIALQQLITALQRAKVLHVHRNTCARKRHAKCELSALLVHHHNILGAQLSHSTSNKFPLCCVSSMYNLMLSILLRTNCETVSFFLANNLFLITTCCCSKRFVYENLLRFAVSHAMPALHRDIYRVIEHYFRVQKNHSLQSCECGLKPNTMNTNSKHITLNESSFTDEYTTDSACYASDSNRDNFGEGFALQYRLLLNNSDPQVRQLVSKHLWNLIHYCDDSVKSILYQQVLMPTFFSKETNRDLMQHILNLLGSSISDTNIAKVFINFGGLKNLRKMLNDSENSLITHSLFNVLEVLVISEAENLFNNNNHTSNNNTMGEAILFEQFPCLSTFIGILNDNLVECIFRLKPLLLPPHDHSCDDTDFNDDSKSSCDSSSLDNYDFDKLLVYLYYASRLLSSNLKLINISAQHLKFIRKTCANLFHTIYDFLQILLNVLVAQITVGIKLTEEKLEIERYNEWTKLLIEITELTIVSSLKLSPLRRNNNLDETLVNKSEIIQLVRQQVFQIHYQCKESERTTINQLLNMLINCSLSATQISSSNAQNAKYFKTCVSVNDSQLFSSNESTDVEDCYDSGYDADLECFGQSNTYLPGISLITKTRLTNKDANLPLIVNGEFCEIVIEFLSLCQHLYDRQHADYQTIVYLLTKLVTLCRDNVKNREVLHSKNCANLLINGFNALLKTNNTELRGLQLAIVELFIEMSYYKINCAELKTFLELFKENTCDDIYLNAMNRLFLIRGTEKLLQPTHYLCLPAKQCAKQDCDHPMMSWVNEIRKNLSDDPIGSAAISWNVIAAAFPLPAKSNYILSSEKKFSVAFWAYFDKDYYFLDKYNDNNSEAKSNSNLDTSFIDDKDVKRVREDNKMHIFSFAFDGSTVEVWFDFHYSCFVYRICKVLNNKMKVFDEKIQANNGDLLGKWHLFRFNFTVELADQSKSTHKMSIEYSIDGMSDRTIELNYPTIVPKRPHSTAVLFGSTQCLPFRLKCANFMIFQSNLSLESTFYLFSLGSDFNNFSHFNLTENNYLPIIAKNVTEFDVFGALSRVINSSNSTHSKYLKKNLMLVFQARQTSQYLIFTSNLNDIEHLTRVNKFSISFTMTKPLAQSFKKYNLQISEYNVIKFAELVPNSYYGIHKAISDAGGVGLFMLLFARIVETCSNADSQAKCLEIIAKVVESHVQHAVTFHHQYQGLTLIAHVLETNKAVISLQMLKNFAIFSITKYDNNPVIISAENFSVFVSAWKAWHQNGNIAKHFYDILTSLIVASNPYKQHNVQQMQKQNVLHILLSMVQQMYIYLNTYLSTELCQSLIYIIKTIIEKPLDISLLSDVFECIILLHKPESAFVRQSRNAFFNLFPSDWYVKDETNRRKSIDDEWRVISLEEEEVAIDSNDAFDEIMIGFIDLIGQLVENMSDTVIDTVVGPIIKLEFLIVLANNPSSRVRECVLKTLFICLKRSVDAINSFTKIKGFNLLANQLHKYLASAKCVDICFGIILEVPDFFSYNFNLEDTALQDSRKAYSTLQLNAFVPLFALLPKCVHDITLCNNALQTIQKILLNFESTSLMRELYDNGLLECLTKIIINYNICKKSMINVSDNEEDIEYEEDSINQSIYPIIRQFSSYFFSASGSPNHKIYCSALNFYAVFEVTMRTPEEKTAFRECQIALIEAAFDCVHSISESKKNIPYRPTTIGLGLNTADLFLNMFVSPDTSYGSNHYAQIDNNFDDSFSFASHDNYERNKNQTVCQLNTKEIIERMKDLITKSVDFIIFRDECVSLCEKERFFSRSVLHVLSQFMEIIAIETHKHHKKLTKWITILWKCKDVIRYQISRLSLYLLMPLQTIEDRKFSVSLLSSFTFLTKLINTSANYGSILCAFILELIDNLKEANIADDCADLNLIIETIRSKCSNKISHNRDSFKDDMSNWYTLLTKGRVLFNDYIASYNAVVFDRWRSQSNQLIDKSIEVTQSIVEAQNKERKQYIYHLKRDRTNKFMTRKAWKQLVEQFTHEKAIWFYKDGWPDSWQLDPTEGPHRIRRKMMRCSLNIENRFFRNPKKQNGAQPKLFSYLFDSDWFDSSTLIDRLHANEHIIYTCQALIITTDEEFPGEILISNSSIHFISQAKEAVSNNVEPIITEVWYFDDITEIQPRRYQLQNKALEIFLNNGLTYLIAFESNSIREEFQCQITNKSFIDRISFNESRNSSNENRSLILLTQMWRDRQITNFEYLTHLNKFSGRSFNDLMQYPVFPAILASYETEILHLEQQTSYRKLWRPIAIQNKSREKYYMDQYNYLKSEYDQCNTTGEYLMPATTAPFHYGAHYSNSGTVLHFLVRLPPFTQMFLKYQDNNFDIPDRTFHSLATSWRLATAESTTDFKELVPEFFFLPEILMNNEQFEFGVRQNGQIVDNVELPIWCRSSARLFILIHRQALESNYVTQNLNKWIDLIFGYKQTGNPAIEAINVFHPATYYGTDANLIKDDPLKRMALQTMIKTFGQMPRQLFSVPHPSISQDAHLCLEKCATNAMSEVIGLKWGSYLGSPADSEPIIIWKKRYQMKTSKLVSLSTNEVFALEPNSSILVTFSRHKGGALITNSYVISAALVKWRNADNAIHIKFDATLFTPLMFGNVLLDEITVCESVPDYNILIVGYASGLLNVYVIETPVKINQNVELKNQISFYGHSSAIKCISICKPFAVAITGDESGVCILWDLNRFCYVRTITTHKSAVELLCVSETLGDIVSVSHQTTDYGSTFMVHTINSGFIGQAVTPCEITCVCYSTAPEGLSINVIATGFSNGVVTLWSSWDLAPVRDIKAPNVNTPIKCLTYSYDNQQLYVAYMDGTVFAWGTSEHKKRSTVPDLILF